MTSWYIDIDPSTACCHQETPVGEGAGEGAGIAKYLGFPSNPLLYRHLLQWILDSQDLVAARGFWHGKPSISLISCVDRIMMEVISSFFPGP